MTTHPEVTERSDFHKIINHYQYKVGVEVGVGAGVNARYLLDNSTLEVLHGVDNFSVRAYRAVATKTKAKLSLYGNRFNLMEMSSRRAAGLFEDGSLDFVYIDAGHRYKSVLADIRAWYPKVRVGGFFGGHDYVVTRRCGVIPATREYFSCIGKEYHVTREPEDSPINRSFWLIKSSN